MDMHRAYRLLLSIRPALLVRCLTLLIAGNFAEEHCLVGRKAWRFVANAMANVPKDTIVPVLGSLASSGRCATGIFEACFCQADGQDITCLALQRSLQIDDF